MKRIVSASKKEPEVKEFTNLTFVFTMHNIYPFLYLHLTGRLFSFGVTLRCHNSFNSFPSGGKTSCKGISFLPRRHFSRQRRWSPWVFFSKSIKFLFYWEFAQTILFVIISSICNHQFISFEIRELKNGWISVAKKIRNLDWMIRPYCSRSF